MKDLSEYLKKFKLTLFKNEDVIEVIRNTINATTHLDLSPNDIQLKGDVVYIKTNPISKNEIFFQKKKIISILHEKGVSKIVDLR